MKTFILTIDYELFLGSRTGSVEKCMVEPTYDLAEILDINSSKMTVFWDILHYYRLTELEHSYPDLKSDKKLIDEQISFLISKGHDIQLHIHPHWLDAQYSNGEWRFTYDRFNIHALSEEENPERIDTILGCITLSKQMMENEVRKYIPGYDVNTFRAGGYLIEPFEKLKKAFEYNSIYIDSSVLPGMSYNNPVNKYDFRNYPEENHYRFTSSPSELISDGKFIEIPVTTLKLPILKNIAFTILRRFKYPDLEKLRMGTGSGESSAKGKDSGINKLFTVLTKPKKTSFTTDGNFAEKFNYMCRRVRNNSTMILHPKLMNQHTLSLMRKKLANKEIKFISINQYMKSIE